MEQESLTKTGKSWLTKIYELKLSIFKNVGQAHLLTRQIVDSFYSDWKFNQNSNLI